MLGWNGIAGFVVGYSAGARLLLSRGFQKPTPQPFVGGGYSDKRITPAERAPPSTPCAPSFVLVVKSSFIIIIIMIIIICT